MKRSENIYGLHDLLKRGRHPVRLRTILKELGCSVSTFHRTRRFMQTELGAPIVYDKRLAGYKYDSEESFELPGIWLNDRELAALVTLEKLAGEQSGSLGYFLEPLHKQVGLLAKAQNFSPDQLHRIRILPMGHRQVPEKTFKTSAEAVLKRCRLHVIYTATDGTESQRMVSPQRIVRYRDNWYLDVWCHKKRSLRTFSLNRISEIGLLNKPCKEISEARLNSHFSESYGIFAGSPRKTAHLIFTPNRARSIVQEKWHPRQRGRFLPDGRYELKFPYGQSRELRMDILRYGDDVEVAGPEDLRREIGNVIGRMLEIYQKRV